MSNEYGLGDLSFSMIRETTTTGNEAIIFKVWGGSLRVNVTKNKEFKPIIEKTISFNKIPLLIKAINQIKTMPPNSQVPLVVSTYNPQEKKWANDYVLTFIKDDKNVYRVSLRWKGANYEAILKGPSGVSFGSDPMSEVDKSAAELESLITYLKDVVPLQTTLTNRKRDMSGDTGASAGPSKAMTKPIDEDNYF